MSKVQSTVVFIAVLVAILVASYIIYTQSPKTDGYRPGAWPEADTAINQATHLFNQKKKESFDFTDGPCLSNALLPGWVLDIAHSPRLSVDDLEENQCTAYISGDAKHFVELDPEGNLIRVK